jgi:hypothetical protein
MLISDFVTVNPIYEGALNYTPLKYTHVLDAFRQQDYNDQIDHHNSALATNKIFIRFVSTLLKGD